MLVLTRKRGELIHIGDNVVIKVVRLTKSTVKIGIEAPESIRVLRGELCVTPEGEMEPADMGDLEFHPSLPVSDQFPQPSVA